MLTVGNVYGHGFDSGQIATLEALGFALRPGVSTYAGSQLCRFLDFETGPSLELIEVTDRSDYESFAPTGMVPYCPGISLLVEDGSPSGLDSYERDFTSLEPYRLEVPYQGDGGPGWHYLNFAEPVLPGIFVWLTALDTPKPVVARTTAHANGVRGVAGLVFACTEGELERLTRLASETIERRPLSIGGITLTATGPGCGSGRFSLRAVVLRADSLHAFGVAPSPEATRIWGRPVVRVETNPLCWDLWVTT
ncbi:MAG TPA: hypothetical protein VGK53_03210 [Propionicimonas sp.]|jgi:hypothetical protein